ncbi:hypothetical protein BC938DRAFT_484325 [Jimgerdemannia flammicorona]|uniref:RRM domain-containing protein n=1 Tax=Jimgerdemannia flammicorona TaxID=994334 RepID=A0A433QVF7_9FUNG|nr:hypothetical protein BC938DRAFT_484325 [Jimgerdemannia flammicorona]
MSNFRLTSTSSHEMDNHSLRPLNDLRRNKDAIGEDDDDDSVSSYSSSSSLSSWNSEDERLGNRRGRYHKYLGNHNVDDNRAHQMAALKNNNKRRWPSIIERSSRSRSRSPTRSSTRSPSPPSDEVDEFGRVKRRRGKFYTERSDRTSRISDEGEDGNMFEHKSASTRGYCKQSDIVSRERVRRDTRRSRDREEGRRRSANRWRQMDDPYVAAASYIDTEFFATKIYVGELQNVTEKALRLAFERFGEIKHVKMVEGKEFAFITFDRKDQALKAIQHMNGSVLGRRSIKVNRAKIPERNRVGFGNVPWQDDDGMLAKQGEATDYLSSLAPQEKSISLQDRVATMHQLAAPLDAPSSESGYMLDPRAQLPMDPRAARAERQVLSYDDL